MQRGPLRPQLQAREMVQVVSLRRCVRRGPKPTSSYRYSMWDCNTQDCSGDEGCIAKQDIIIEKQNVHEVALAGGSASPSHEGGSE